jgi:plastocyanin
MKTAFLLLLSAMPVAQSEPTGTITGTVRFLGEVPAPKKILTTDGSEIYHSDLVVAKKTKGLRDVVVHVDNAPPPKKASKLEWAGIDQKEMIFVPRVLTVTEAQKVRFDNSDNCNHGVRGLSLLKDNEFNSVVAPNTFHETSFKAQRLPILIDCPLHPWMKAYVFCFAHPYHAVTDPQGSFTIPRVPAGKYEVVFRHPDTGRKETRTVEVLPGKNTPVVLEWRK